MGAVSNTEIVEGLRAGRREAVTRLMARYYRRLIGEAVSVFGVSKADAEEIADDVLLAVVRGIGGFAFRRGEGDFHIWLMTIFRHRVCDHLRRSALTGGLMVAFDEALTLEDEGQGGVEAEVMREIVRRYAEDAGRTDSAVRRGVLAEVEQALDALQSWERVLLRCRALDVPYEQIAEYTGKRPAILKVYYPRVRKRFLALLQRMEEKHAAACTGYPSADRVS